MPQYFEHYHPANNTKQIINPVVNCLRNSCLTSKRLLLTINTSTSNLLLFSCCQKLKLAAFIPLSKSMPFVCISGVSMAVSSFVNANKGYLIDQQPSMNAQLLT